MDCLDLEIDDPFNIENDNEKQKKKVGKVKVTCVPGHLATPIYDDECRFLLENRRWYCRRHFEINKKIHESEVVSIYSITNDPIRFLQRWVKSLPRIDRPEELYTIVDAIDNWTFQKTWFMTPCFKGGVLEQERLSYECSQIKLQIKQKLEMLEEHYSNMRKVEGVKDAVCYKEIKHGNFLTYFNLSIERDVAYLKSSGRNILFPTSLFLCAIDSVQSMFPLQLYWIICDVLNKYPGRSIFDRGNHFINIFTDLRPQMKQDFFTLLSTWEPLMIGKIIAQEDDVGFDQLYATQLAEVETLEERNNVKINVDSILPDTDHDINVMIDLELLGLNKFFGYPTLEADKLLDPLKEYGRMDQPGINTDILKRVYGVFKRDLLINYYKRKRVYPIVVTALPKLFSLISQNLPIPEKLLKDYDLFYSIKFGKTFEYDYTPDMVELLKDSSTANNLSAWPAMYDKCGFQLLYGKRPPTYPPPIYETRTILNYLKASPDDIRHEMESRERGEYNEEDHIAVICGKERELKGESGRGFTIQTGPQRMQQASNEYNIGKTIFQFVPEQSMTDSESVESKRILAQVKDLLRGAEVSVLDMKKWCLHWRWEVVYQSGEIYDDLFGLEGIYSNRHSFFINCNIFSNSRIHPPNYDEFGNPIPGTFYFNDMLGGMEGMHQKQWTHITISAIRLSAEMSDLDVDIIGQGDNQMARLKYKEGDNVALKRQLFKDNLFLVQEGIGQHLKERETWSSRLLHEYGKMRVYKGRYVSQGSKKACKLMADSNDLLDSIPSSMGTINTMTEGIARGDYNPDAAYILNSVMCAEFLVRKRMCPIKAKSLKQALVFPLDAGGLTISSYSQHCLRGHSDHLTIWVSLLKYMENYDRDLFNSCITTWKLTPNNEEITDENFIRLLEDIYSLRISGLPSIELSVREASQKFLNSDYVTNPTITQLREENSLLTELELASSLRTMNPFFAQIAHVLFQHSNAGLMKRLPSRFTSVRTIESIVVFEENTSLVAAVAEQNRKYRSIFKARMNSMDTPTWRSIITENTCPTKICRILREISWGVKFVAHTKPTFQHQFHITPIDIASEEQINQSIICKVGKSVQLNPRICSEQYGPYRPYIGSSTSQKVKRPSIEFAEKTGQTKSLIHLGNARSWARILGSANLEILTSTLIREKLLSIPVPENLDNIDDLFQCVISGNIGHRFLTEMEKPYSMINSLPGFTTHFHQTSNNMASLSEGGRDFNIFYQLVYVSNMVQIAMSGLTLGYLEDTYSIALSCKDCLEDLTNIEFDISHVHTRCWEDSQKRPADIQIRTRIPYIQELTEYVFGLTLAKNVDDNFRVQHMNERDDKGTEAKKEQISLNDLRGMRLQRVFNVMIMHSRHLRSVLSNNNQYTIIKTLDLSLCFIAECIINSGLLDQFLSFFCPIITEHSSLTQSEKMSSMIIGNLKQYVLENLHDILSDSLMFDFTNEPIKARPIYTLYLKLSRKEVLKRTIMKVGNKKIVHSLLEIAVPIEVEVDKASVIGIWRLHGNRCNKVEEIYPSLQDYLPENYPFTQVISYHNSRLIDVGHMDIKELSFLSRPLGTISSACNKYIEILIALSVFENPESIGSILSLAEGSGGTTAILSCLFPNSELLYNTLIDSDTDNRDDLTDWLPPASRIVGTSERYSSSELARGENNILSDKFVEKLCRKLDIRSADLVTMDAENIEHSDNFQFVTKLVPILCLYECGIIIFKLFDEELLESKLKNYIFSPKYDVLMFKPISSNPVGTECFLIMVHTRMGLSKTNMRHIQRMWKFPHRWMKEKCLMSPKHIKILFDLSKTISRILSCEIDDVELLAPCRFSGMIKTGDICCFLCTKLFVQVLESIDFNHASEMSGVLRTLARSGGIQKSLKSQCVELVALSILIFEEKPLEEKLFLMYSLCIIENFQEFRVQHKPFIKVDMSGGNGEIFREWPDTRSAMRELGGGVVCSCLVEFRAVTQAIKNNSLSHRILEGLRHIGVLSHDIYHSCRKIVNQRQWNVLSSENGRVSRAFLSINKTKLISKV